MKQGRIFPFVDNVDRSVMSMEYNVENSLAVVLKSVKSNCRFQGQTELCGSKPCDFRLAIEEAFLAEHGFSGARVDATTISGQPANYVSFPIQEATDSNHEQECQSRIQASKCNVIYA